MSASSFRLLVSLLVISWSLSDKVSEIQRIDMRRAIGFLIILLGLSHFFSSSFTALDDAGRESFKAVETAALVSQQQMRTQLE